MPEGSFSSKKMKLKTDIDIYNYVTSKKNFQLRAKTGSSADLKEIGDFVIEKTDKIGEAFLVDHEGRMYLYLENIGFNRIPEYIYLDRDYIQIERLGDGVSLYDLGELAYLNQISEEKWIEICEKCDCLINEFHDYDMIHGDLHPGNIIFTLNRIGGITPYLIDFGLSSPEQDKEEILEMLDERGVRFLPDIDYSRDGDRLRLINALKETFVDSSISFSSGIRVLGG